MTSAARGNPEGDQEIISLVLSVNEAGMTGHWLDGPERLAEIEALILASINSRWRQASCVCVGPALINPDLEYRHPYYQSEIALPFLLT